MKSNADWTARGSSAMLLLCAVKTRLYVKAVESYMKHAFSINSLTKSLSGVCG